LKVNRNGRVATIRIAPKKETLSINETYTKPSTVWDREISFNKLEQISLVIFFRFNNTWPLQGFN